MIRSAIVLRKIGGVFSACRLSAHHLLAGGSQVAGAPTLAGISFALCAMLILPLIALALVAALVTPHATTVLANVGALKLPTLLGLAAAGTTETVSNALVEKRERFAAKQKELGEVFEKAKDGSVFDFSRKNVLELLGASDSTDAVAKVKSRNLELEAIGSELQQAEMKAVQDSMAARDDARNQPFTMSHSHAAAAGNGEMKSFGELFIESKAYTDAYRKNGQVDIPAKLDIGLKTLMSTSAGFGPESTRTGLLVEKATRPIQILDLIPVRPITQAVDKYMEETTRTHSAAEKAEAATYAESVFVWTERTNTVRKITDSIPVTDEQLEDAPEVSAILDQRLRFGLRQRLDTQVMQGDGNAPNLLGVASLPSIQTQAKSTDPIFDAVFKAMMLVRITGRANPNALCFHPTDWQTVRLTRTADGIYIMGSPAEPGPMSLFGLPVALFDSGSAGTAFVGDFANFSYIGERRGVEVQIGYSGTQFVEGKKTLRADLRAVFTVTRQAAFCSITGL